jgi:hypothetical protein
MTKPPRVLISTIAGVAALAVASSAAFAQAGMMGQGQGMRPGAMGPGMQQMPGTPGQGMMDPEMMRMMMRMMLQMMNMMRGQGMGEPGMMGQAMGPGMMGAGGMQAMMAPGMAGRGLMGMRVTHVQNLTTDDVRYFFRRWLEREGNPRLKLGKVEQTDEDTIVAEIVTVDDSLVQRFKVDRHSGEVQPDTGEQEQQQSHH